MKQKLGFFAFFSVILLLSSCHRFTQKFDETARVCGVAEDSIQADDVYVLLENPAGQALAPEQLLTAQSRLLLSAGQMQSIPITSRGCLKLGRTQGTLQALTLNPAWSLAAPIDFQNLRGNLVHLQLVPSPRIEASLQCLEPGYYANNTLPFPIRWNANGSLATARFELSAENIGTRQIFPIYEKAYGINPSLSQEPLSTALLPTGSYRLRLRVTSSQLGWDQQQTLPQQAESCSLTVIHGQPLVGGLGTYPLQQGIAVFSKGQNIPWQSIGQESQLHICREARTEIVASIAAPIDETQCPSRNYCQDESHYTNTSAPIADTAGVFDYFALARDRTGTVSRKSCQTLLVTDQSPKLRLRWDETSWNKSLALMDGPRPLVHLKAERQLSENPLLFDSALSSRLQCRAEFINADQTIRPGRSVLCLSGRCEGQSLESFKPCSESMDLSLSALLPEIGAKGGNLRLIVRFEDGLSPIQEQSASIGIQPQLWKPQRKSEDNTLESRISRLLQDRDGHIFASSFSTVKLWNEKPPTSRPNGNKDWDILPSLKSDSMPSDSVKIWLSQDGSLISQQKFFIAEQMAYETRLGIWKNSQWQDIPLPAGLENFDCNDPQPEAQGGFWCRVEDSIALYHNNVWQILEMPASLQKQSCMALDALFFLSMPDASYLLGCGQELFRRAAAATQWTPVAGNDDLPLRGLGLDAAKQLWMLRGFDAMSMQVQIMPASSDRWQNLPKPAFFPGKDLRRSDFVIDARGQVLLGPNAWDPLAGQWKAVADIQQLSRDQRFNPALSPRGDLYWESEQSILRSDAKGLREWNLQMLGLRQAEGNRLPVLFDKDGSTWFLASEFNGYPLPYRVQLRPWLVIPRPMKANNSSISNLWLKDNERPEIYVPGDGLYQLEADGNGLATDANGWSLEMKSPLVNESEATGVEAFEPYLIGQQSLVYKDPLQGWRSILNFGNDEYFFGGTRDAWGGLWIYNGNAAELALIQDGNVRRILLDPSQGNEIRGFYKITSGFVVATDLGFILKSSSEDPGQFTPWPPLGPGVVSRLRQLDADTLLISTRDENWTTTGFWTFEPASGKTGPFFMPERANDLVDISRTPRGDFVLIVDFNIYLTDGKTGRKIFSETDLYSLKDGPSDFLQYMGLQIDQQDRIWVSIRKALIMIPIPRS